MAAGVPLEVEGSGPETRYVLRGIRKDALWFTMGDALALCFGRQLVGFLEGTPVHDWLGELRDKLACAADAGTLDREARLAKKLVYVSEPYWAYASSDDTVDSVLRAVLDERELHGTYATRTGQRDYVLHPLALVIYRRALYVLARDTASDRLLRLAVERFESARVGQPFSYPRRFDPREHLAHGFGIFDDGGADEEVRLRFQPDVADLVRARCWHPSQAFEDREDGTLDLVLQTRGAELGRLALEWGDRVTVISPPALRARVRRELQRALASYDDGSEPQGHVQVSMNTASTVPSGSPS